jgi:anti-sigma factor RsiW
VDCRDCRDLLPAYLDGELDLVRHLETERHLRDCEACMGLHENHHGLRAALGSDGLYYRAPESLRARVRASLVRADRPARRRALWVRLGTAAVAAGLLVLGWALGRGGVGLPGAEPSAYDRQAQQVVASHVRSLLLDEHRFDVKSSNRHVVKPWFAGKVDFAPAVPDLSAHEFTLLGGRLDYLDGRPVAALVYQRRQHVVNLFVWAAPGPGAPARAATRQGFHLVQWKQGDMTWWAVSDLNEQELQEFVDLVRDPGRR